MTGGFSVQPHCDRIGKTHGAMRQIENSDKPDKELNTEFNTMGVKAVPGKVLLRVIMELREITQTLT